MQGDHTPDRDPANPAAAGGEVHALTSAVYQELRALAGQLLANERAGHTLQPTALVHEAYMKLAGLRSVRWRDRAHFAGVAAAVMRRVLVDHARAKGATKRGGGAARVRLDAAEPAADGEQVDVLALDAAVTRLAALDERRARVVELRFFGGLSVDEAAAALGVSPRTVESDWRLARAWLRRELTRDQEP